ncbi:MAG: HYR domain-containing protein [Opitutus sp.]
MSTVSRAATAWVVDSLSDVPVVGQTTLRQAVTGAAAGDSIEFAPTLFAGVLPKTITLASALTVKKNLTVIGPGDATGTQTPALRLRSSGSDRILQVTSAATVTFAGVSFQGGVAPGGGAVLVDAGAAASFVECDFTGNVASGTNFGGAILNRGTLTLDSCLVGLNRSASGGGLASYGKLQVLRSLIEGNVASNEGGGLYVSGADFSIESSTFATNTAGTGGAIAFSAAGGKTVNTATLTAITVAENIADAQSGGLYVSGAGAIANVSGSVFARNVTTNNGGAQTPHDLATQNSGKINSVDYNIVVKPGSTFSPYGTHDQIGVDPLLLPLANYGGRTRTFAIGQESPAYNTGSPTFVGNLIKTDQRGFPRVWLQGNVGRADAGAFEFFTGLTCAPTFVFEAAGAKTPGTLEATLTLPTAGTVTVVWTVAGVAGVPTTVTVPAGGQPQLLTYDGSFAFGATAVSVRATAGALVLTCSMTVNVVDTTPPKITLAGASPYYVEYGTTYVDPGATAFDIRDGNVAVNIDASAVNMSALGSYMIFYRATDAVGNQASASRGVIVVDTKRPVIGSQPNLVVEATSSAGAVVTYSPTATDNAGTVIVTTSPISGSTFPLGTTLVTITAKDVTGNTATGSFTVTVQDTTAPVINAQPNVIVEAINAAGASASFTPTATDAVSLPTVSTSPLSGAPFPLGTTPVKITAKDAAGNIATSTFNVIVKDTTAPVIAAQADLTVLATGAFGADVVLAPTATDAVSAVTVTTAPASGTIFPLGTTIVTITAVDAAGNQATRTFNLTVIDPYGVTLKNVIWPLAIDLTPKLVASPGKLTGVLQQAVAQAGEARWYKFRGLPDSRIEVTLTKLPANLDVVIYTDIKQAYNELLGLTGANASPADKTLALLGVEYAPDMYSPDMYSPEAYAPEQYSPDAFSPEAYAPELYSPDMYSPEAYSPEIYAPEAYAPEAYAPEAYAPDLYAPDIYSPEAYASAQQRTLLGFSALPGTLSEGVRFNTYSKTGEFYVRVRGQNGVFSNKYPYELTVTINGNLSSGVTNFVTTPSTSAADVASRISGNPSSLIVWDRARIAGTAIEKDNLAASLAKLATVANGVLVDVGTDAQIVKLNVQADTNPYSPITKNLVGDAIRNLIQLYRKAAPGIADVTLVGGDDVIPFFRSDDQALLANEANYFPPVLDGTHSQSALRYSQVLSQDRYGSSQQLVLATGSYDLPDLAVGRLVETAVEVKAYVDKYVPLFDGTSASGVVPTPKSAFVAGYDFLADSADAVKGEFSAGLGAGATVDTLISPMTDAPALGWTADQLRASFLGSRHDLAYLAGHFSTSRALAADYTTRMQAQEVVSSSVNLAYALILSAGCHSGYSTVDKEATLLTGKPDWAQAFSRKQAIWISGTGYQYGDTDFVEYTERLLLDVARALRTGTGPVSVGRALVEAKRRYLADTPTMRGIHEKTLLELALYGLPMVKINLAGARLNQASPTGEISSVAGVNTGPGVGHGLKRGELAFNPVLTLVNKTLDVVGSSGTTTASYFTGSDGIVTIPGEPVRPLESFNVSRPEGLVRGIGFRGGNYSDLGGFRPFTGAPATETRGVHGRFSTEVFYPVRPWNLNQVGEFFASSGISELNVFPTQFISDDPNAVAGTLRRYGSMKFSVFYSPETSAAALANAPAINLVSSMKGPSSITFAIQAAAALGAGVQEVWITYTGLPGSPHYGSWESFTLTAPSNINGIGLWTGSLPLSPGADPGLIRFMVQAVNGFGSVAQSTNFGRYFIPGDSTLDGIGETGSVSVVKLLPPLQTVGAYRSSVPVSASLVDGEGHPLSGRRIQFRIGPVIKTVFTNSAGVASTQLILTAQPDLYALEANFAGDLENQNASDRQPFTVTKMATKLTFDSGVTVPDAAHVVVTLRAIDGTPIKERTVAFLLNNGSETTAIAEITDGAGQARLGNVGIPAGTYQVSVFFAVPVKLSDGTTVSLSDALYEGSSASQSFKIGSSLKFGDVQAWVAYADSTAPGASENNPAASKVELAGDMASADPLFGPNWMLSKLKAKTITADIRLTLSGKTLAAGSVVLDVQATDSKHWRGDVKLNGASVQLYVDWDGSGGTGKYHVWVDAAAGSGPPYSLSPALLSLELTFGTGTNEKPAGGIVEVGGSANPWTQEGSEKRVRSHQ